VPETKPESVLRRYWCGEAFNADCNDVEKYCSSGWEYFIMWEDLGL